MKKKNNWIAGAIKHPGALHEALDVPEGQNIPKSKLKSAEKKGGKVAKMSNMAETLGKLRKK